MQNLLSLFPSLLLLGLACVVGMLLTTLIWGAPRLKTRLACGTVLGLAGLAWVGFLCASVGGLNRLTIGVTAALLLVLLVWWRRRFLELIRPLFFQTPLPSRWVIVGEIVRLSLWLGFFSWLFSRVIMMEPDGLHTAPANNYGDLAFHFNVVTSFADADNFPPRNPIFAGLKFTYPFLMDFLSALLHKAGASWAAAFFLPNVLLALALVGVIELLTERFTESVWAARLTPVLFFLSGGLGFIYAVRDWQRSPASLWEFLWHLPTSYTKNDELNLQWGNMLTTLIVPQRSLLLGIPVFALIVILWAQALGVREAVAPARRRHYLLAAGVLAGAMPFLHAHGFFAVMMVSAMMALVFFSWDWLAFFLPAGILALPQALWLSGTGTRSSLFKPHFGWAMGEGSFGKFFALNFGVFFVLLMLALVGRELRARRFYAPFLLCLTVPHVVLLAPWAWDNIKVLLYWYLVSCPVVVGMLAHWWKGRRPAGIVLSTVLFGALILSGGLDVWRSLSPVEKLRLFDAEQVQIAELIKQRIPPHALVLCAPIHNSVLALSGRQMVMGYPGHLWSHGIQAAERERDVRTIYQGGAVAQQLLQEHGIDYVIVGPVEYSEWQADEGFFAATYRTVIDEVGYRVYQIK